MFDKDIPGSNCIREKNYSCIYLIYMLFHEKFSECFHCIGVCNWEVVYFLGKKEFCY